MNRRLNLDVHLQGTLTHNGSRRAFAARLDMTIKRTKVTSRALVQIEIRP
jgi:hypothetical protein